ncbi:MAG: long-chain N-acyl amino acid synthase [Burkholderiaceae bacterium]|nr:long-chain N-acyl amino acid synthase [Burkholderiaceae bacterium]
MADDYPSTLIAASLLTRRKAKGMLVEGTRLDLLPDGADGPPRFKIKAAEQESRRSLIGGLLRSRYAWRGYQSVSLAASQTLDRFTLVALDDEQPLGTITVAFDMGKALGADDAFRTELNELRAAGVKLCEFTKLAVDPTTATKRVLAALFHVAYIVAHRVRGFDQLVIEVNPRHQRYYERMLGMTQLGPERMNRAVNAPAILLTTPFDHIREQIAIYGGQPERTSEVRTLYPFAFSADQEANVVRRLENMSDRQTFVGDTTI